MTGRTTPPTSPAAILVLTCALIVSACSSTASPAATTVELHGVDRTIDLTARDLEAWWADELPAAFGVGYEPVAGYGGYDPDAGDAPVCAGPVDEARYRRNAFYCGAEDTVWWDTTGLMEPLFEEYGDFTVALVLAHEWGHVAQARFGFGDAGSPTVIAELQADCFAGAWAGSVERGERPFVGSDVGDLEEAMVGYLLIGDRLGTNPAGEAAHGGSFDRLTAFIEGFSGGTAECATYASDPPTVVFIPLREDDDPDDGGDLPYAETAPLLIESLEVFWTIVFPEVTGEEWDPVDDAIAYRPSTGVVPPCGGFEAEAGFYRDNVFYCPADDYVAWDDEALFPDLYEHIGDFAIGLVLGIEWARAAQERAGLDLSTAAAQRQAECLAGVWTAALVPPNPTGIRLSAGDLEEAIAGFLRVRVGSDDAMPSSAFVRFEAFKSGFFEGAPACGFPG